MNDQADPPVDLPAIGVSFKHTLDDYREVVFQGYFAATASDMQVNELLDKLSTASDRLKAKAHLPTIQKLLEIKKDAQKTETSNLLLHQTEHDLQTERWKRDAQTSGRREWKPTPAQTQALAQIKAKIGSSEQNLRVLEKEIAEYTRQLADAEGKLGAGA